MAIMKKPGNKRLSLAEALCRHSGRRTVLGVALPVLSALIDSLEHGKDFPGLDSRQIETGFRELCGKFVHSQFHTTYLDRRLGKNGFLVLREDRYRFRPDLFGGDSVEDLRELRDRLLASLQDAADRRRAVIDRLERACGLDEADIEPRRRLVEEFLRQFRGTGGENFEILAFAILREYFRPFGFHLQRFSTTHANDGGIDFVGGDSIYQVSTDESLPKLRGDLAKAPDRQRVVVRPNMTAELHANLGEHVLESVELAELLTHFAGWLLERDVRSRKSRRLQAVLRTALSEFRREEKADLRDAS